MSYLKPPANPADRKPGYVYEGDYDLPAGKTCADCYAVGHCTALGMTTREATKCDFLPVRFKEPQP